MLIYGATVLALIQPLTPRSAAQRLLQVLGLDFMAELLLALAILAGCWKYSDDHALPPQAGFVIKGDEGSDPSSPFVTNLG